MRVQLDLGNELTADSAPSVPQPQRATDTVPAHPGGERTGMVHHQRPLSHRSTTTTRTARYRYHSDVPRSRTQANAGRTADERCGYRKRTASTGQCKGRRGSGRTEPSTEASGLAGGEQRGYRGCGGDDTGIDQLVRGVGKLYGQDMQRSDCKVRQGEGTGQMMVVRQLGDDVAAGLHVKAEGVL
jgi:hypothetical protein